MSLKPISVKKIRRRRTVNNCFVNKPEEDFFKQSLEFLSVTIV